jgi:hypothetical protein
MRILLSRSAFTAAAALTMLKQSLKTSGAARLVLTVRSRSRRLRGEGRRRRVSATKINLLRRDRSATGDGATDFFIRRALAPESAPGFGIIEPIRRRVREGMPYIGSSAGSNVAGPTIRTTNDMPIVQPVSFDALGLVRFQISPHYLDPDPRSTHMGETQEERILQFLEENEAPVAGLREGAMLRVEGDSISLRGLAGARIFRRGEDPVEVAGDELQRSSERRNEIRRRIVLTQRGGSTCNSGHRRGRKMFWPRAKLPA